MAVERCRGHATSAIRAQTEKPYRGFVGPWTCSAWEGWGLRALGVWPMTSRPPIVSL